MKEIDKEGVEWLVEMDVLQPNLLKRTMKTITKSVIKLSDIPEHLQEDPVLQGHKVHTYAEFHIDDSEQDELTLWLLSQYPTLKRKTSFLIHIDQETKSSEDIAHESYLYGHTVGFTKAMEKLQNIETKQQEQ